MFSLSSPLRASAVRSTLPLAALLLLSSAHASASLITYTGEDLGAGPGSAHPNSSAAAASFTVAASSLGSVSTLTFESTSVGSFSSLAAAPGVTLTGANYLGGKQSINNTPNYPANPSLDGFNTTPGGHNYAEVEGGTLTFSFASPTDFFGAYFSGIQTSFYSDTVTFSDGSIETISIPGAGTNNSTGALDFVGFTDAGKSISSVTINGSSGSSGADFFGVDDVMYQSQAMTATPEPSSVLLLLTGLSGASIVLRRKLSI